MRRNYFVYFVVFFIVSVSTFGIVSIYRQDAQKKKRTDDLRQLAATLGFVFDEDQTDLRARFGDFGEFTSGGFGRNTMIGSLAGQLVAITDYVIVRQRRSSSSETVRSMVVFPEGAPGLPDLVLFFGRYRKYVDEKVTPEIAFAKTDKFSETYAVRGADEPAIQGVFGAKTRAFLSVEQGWRVETRNGAAILWRDSVVAPTDVLAFITNARTVIDAFRLR